MPQEHPYGHMVQEYFVGRQRELARRRAEARAQVRTAGQLKRLRAQVRRKLRACFGRLPARTALNARVSGTVRRRRYTIEKLIYESRPHLPVTANLYLPRRARGPFPAVLGTCGHSLRGKGEPLYQAFAAHLARQGYAVLIYDPLGQGERSQYGRGDGPGWPRGCTAQHTMAGNQMSLLGEFLGAWRAWDGIRGLDYLLARPEVDPARVGVTGNSGGGTMTTWLTALDDRITMVAPSCFVTRYLCNLENELPQDSEQHPPGLLAAGLDMADFFVARIPRPTLLLGQAKDFFDCRGLKAIHQELRRLYAILGRADDVELFIGPREHGFHRENREAMYRFFNRHAGVRASPREPAGWKPESDETLNAAPGGQVRRLAGARRVFDFTRERAAELAARRGRPGRRALPAAIRRRLNLPPRRGVPHYRCLPMLWQTRAGPRRRNALAVETAPGIQALVHILHPPEWIRYFPACREATIYVPHLSAVEEFLAGKAPKARWLFGVEVRGIGHLQAATCGDADFLGQHGSDYFYAAHSLMMGEPYAGRRVHDLLAVLDLFAANGTRWVHLVGRGLGAIWATFAACLHPLVERVTLHDALRSYHELTQQPLPAWPLSALPRGVLNDFDLPDCHRLLRATRRLRIVRPWDAGMRPVRRRT